MELRQIQDKMTFDKIIQKMFEDKQPCVREDKKLILKYKEVGFKLTLELEHLGILNDSDCDYEVIL